MNRGYRLNFLLGIALLVVTTGVFTSCGDTPNERVDVNFVLEYDGEPLVMSVQEYAYPDGTPMIFSKCFFYVSNFTLSNADKTSNKSEVYALDFEAVNTSELTAKDGINIGVPDLGSNTTYTTMSFDLGIDATRNAMEPSEFDNSNPLSAGDYWAGWNSYIFSKMEGKLDTDGDGIYESNMSLHLGSDEAVRRVTLQAEFDQNTEVVNIIIDLKNLFVSSGGMYDIYTYPTTHSLDNMPQVMELSDNLVDCFGIDE